MRPGFFFGGFFWGLILVFIGAGIIVNTTMHINIPFFQLFFAFILIYCGVMVLFGRSWSYRGSWHGYKVYKYEAGSGDQNYSMSFGGGNIDLSGADVSKSTVKIRIHCSFGGGTVLVNPDIPLRIQAVSSFGGVTFPDRSSVGFSSGSYQSKNFNKDAAHLYIDTDVSFGGLRFVTSKEDVDDWQNWREARHEWKHQWKDERRKWRSHHDR